MPQDSFSTRQVRDELTAAKAKLQADPDNRIAQLDVERLKKRITVAEREDALKFACRAEREAAEAAKTQAHQEREQVALEADLRARYDQAMPKPVSDNEWDKVKPDLLHRHRLAEMDARDRQVAKARASGAYRI